MMESSEQVPDSETPTSGAPVTTRPAQMGLPSIYSSSEWDLPTKRTVLVILLVAMVFVIWISRPILPMVVISAIVAYLLSPIVDLGERIRIPRSITTILLFVLLLVGIILLPVFLVPVLLRQLTSISNFDVQSTVRGVLFRVNDTIYNLPDTVSILGFDIPIDQTVIQVQEGYRQFNFIPTLAEILTYIQQLIITTTNVVGTTAFISFNVVGGIFQGFVTILIVFFLSLYMTKDAPSIRAYVASLFPASYQSEVVDLLRRMGFIWNSFFRGQIFLSVIIGLVTYGALTAVGMPGALLLAILAGALEVVPNLGPVIAMLPAIVIALIQGSPVLAPMGISNFGFAVIIAAIYFIIQQLENNILVPRIIGSSVNLHPIIVILGVAVGFNVFGILGALLAAPVIASLRVLGSYVHAKLLGYPPFVERNPARRRQRRFSYRRTVTGDELPVSSPRTAEALSAVRTSSAAGSSAPGDDEGPRINGKALHPDLQPSRSADAARGNGVAHAPSSQPSSSEQATDDSADSMNLVDTHGSTESPTA